jgi:methylenetetrahydrofolate dehydrogenase (NADP+)/methenyltetrahydrofolate cyclohydrolase
MLKYMAKTCFITDKNELDLDAIKQADLLIVGARSPRLIKKEMIKEGCIIIDVGINKEEEGSSRIVGDVDFEEVIEKVKAITPVPGGVGPIVVSSLINNTYNAWLIRINT